MQLCQNIKLCFPKSFSQVVVNIAVLDSSDVEFENSKNKLDHIALPDGQGYCAYANGSAEKIA